MNETPPYLTVPETARALGVTEAAVRKAILRGWLPHTLMYGRKLVHRNDVEAYRERTQPGGVRRRGAGPKMK